MVFQTRPDLNTLHNVYINSPNKYTYSYLPGYYNDQSPAMDGSTTQTKQSHNQSFCRKFNFTVLLLKRNQQPSLTTYNNNPRSNPATSSNNVQVGISVFFLQLQLEDLIFQNTTLFNQYKNYDWFINVTEQTQGVNPYFFWKNEKWRNFLKICWNLHVRIFIVFD